jgi:hypothetical protein
MLQHEVLKGDSIEEVISTSEWAKLRAEELIKTVNEH